MQAKGTLGLIATNTVAQGDTREVGLDAMVASGFTITRAIQSRSWPAASANLEFAAVWGTPCDVAVDVPRVADDVPVHAISTLLESAGRVQGNPLRLSENSGVGFIGCYVLGMGFVIEESEAQEWIHADARNAEVLFPYLNGEDLNSRPDNSASRWVIDFREMPEVEASSYVLPWTRVNAAVRPERVTKNAAKYPRMVYEWWKFWNARPVMRATIGDLSEVLVIALVSKTVMPIRVSTNQVFSHALGVFATDDYSAQAVLSSSLHQLWAITYGSTLETRVRYTPSDVFETFPRPEPTERLAEVGRTMDNERHVIMLRRDLGLTKLYNLINDSTVRDDEDVSRMRELHVETDVATMAAYGWEDVSLKHGFHTYRQVERWSLNPAARSEALDRLLLENHVRAANEQSRVGTVTASFRVPIADGTLFDE